MNSLSNYRFPFISLILLVTFYSCIARNENIVSDIGLVASTPGDMEVKVLLGIPVDSKVDFIRWNLILNKPEKDTNRFHLDFSFGEAQPNTHGFKRNGSSRSAIGTYYITKGPGSLTGEIFHLRSVSLPSEILILKITDNIFHLLDNDKRLMVGNGGWSYTFNSKSPINNKSLDYTSLVNSSNISYIVSKQVTFDGRTPCMEFAKENNLKVSEDCAALKWRLILNSHPETLVPTTYILQTTFNRDADISGNWKIIKGITSDPDVVIYQLEGEKLSARINLLVGDENVLFFVNKDFKPFIGNEDFSYTLNKVSNR